MVDSRRVSASWAAMVPFSRRPRVNRSQLTTRISRDSSHLKSMISPIINHCNIFVAIDQMKARIAPRITPSIAAGPSNPTHVLISMFHCVLLHRITFYIEVQWNFGFLRGRTFRSRFLEANPSLGCCFYARLPPLQTVKFVGVACSADVQQSMLIEREHQRGLRGHSLF